MGIKKGMIVQFLLVIVLTLMIPQFASAMTWQYVSQVFTGIDSPKNVINGTIDDVLIYNHSLTLEQIIALYENRTDIIVSQEITQFEVWSAEITPNDGREDGSTLMSNNVTITNAIPTIPSINITSTDPNNYTNGTLTAFHNYNDGDGDAWLSNSTKWFKDTVEQTGLQNTTTVSSALTSASEVWVYSAAVQDAIGSWSLWSNASITIIDAHPYQILTIPDITFPEDGFNDTINGNTYFYDLEGTTLGFEFYGNDTNLNTTITNATGAFLFTAKNDWFGSVTGFITAVDGAVLKGNASNFTITVFNVNDIPTIPTISLLSSDDLNRTNGTITGSHTYADLENNTWAANSTKWYKDYIEQISLYNESSVPNSTVIKDEVWIYSAAVQDSIGDWSDWLNSTPLTIKDSNASVSIITFNHSEGYFDFEDIGFLFAAFDPDPETIDVSLNITNNNVNIFTQMVTMSSGSYSGNLTQKNFNQTQVINISVLPDDVITELKNATKTIKSITVIATDQWVYGVNETESLGYYFNVTESYGYPYDINISVKFYRGGLSYTPSLIEYRNVVTNQSRWNVTFPTPLIPNNHTNISSRWDWNYSVYGDPSVNNAATTSRNQTVDHGYFLTDFFTLPTYILEAERFLARINYSSLQVASISNILFEVLNGLNFTGTLNGTSQFYNNQVYSPLLPDSLNSTTHTLQARANYSYDGESFIRAKNTTFTVSKMIVTDCGGYTNSTIHVFRLWNESIPTKNVTGDVKVAYNAFLTRGQESRNYSFIKTNDWNHSVCLWPAWANFYVDTVIQYEGGGFTPRTFYHYGLLLPNSTPTYTDLYLLDDALDTPITMYVKDQDDNPISDAFIKLLKFYPEESTYRTVQVAQTDATGIGLVKLQITDAFYKLIIEKGGVLIDQTDKSVYLNQPYYFRVNLLADFLDSWNKMDRLNTYLNFPNATGTATFFWNDGQDIVRTGCLEVFTRTAYRDSQLSYECLNSSIGTLSYSINKSVEGHYFAKSYIESNTNNTLYSGEVKELIIENVTLAIFGLFGVFLALLVYMILCLIGATINPSVALALGVLGIVSFVILQFLHLTWVSIILLIIFTVILMYLIRT